VLVASLLLIAGAAMLLVLGLWQSSAVLLAGSIAASLFAAVMLVVGARRVTARLASATDRSLADGELVEEPGEPLGAPPPRGGPTRAAIAPGGPTHPAIPPGGPTHPGDDSTAQTMTIPAQGGVPQQHIPPSAPAGQLDDDPDPPDEPAPQQVSPADAARVGRMLNEVLVVDGRPRYHLPGCVHLLGRESEPLPVSEAIELGFTPCSLCEPDSALLADARRV
jgi:hypothetical protein